MRMPSILASTVFAATVLGSSAALAGPLGIGLPSDPFYIDTSTSYETLVNAPGDFLSGVFKVQAIASTLNPTSTYTYGAGGLYLMGSFSGFKLDTVVTNGSNINLLFTGGSLSYYVNTADSFTIDQGAATDIANASLGSLWLSADPQSIDALGHTLSITLFGASSTSQFGTSLASALADVTGGAAASYFDTNTFLNPFDDHNADVLFSGSANGILVGSCGPDFQVCGSNNLKGYLVPEPLTLSIFGAGLAGAAALRRRKAKKA
jgi:hypothetical protein